VSDERREREKVQCGELSRWVLSAEDGAVFTCDVSPGLDLSAFPVGTQ
jgi:hypothetical protein